MPSSLGPSKWLLASGEVTHLKSFLIRASLLQVATHTCFLRSWVPDGTPNFFLLGSFAFQGCSYTGYTRRVLFHVFTYMAPGARCIRNSKSILDLLCELYVNRKLFPLPSEPPPNHISSPFRLLKHESNINLL